VHSGDSTPAFNPRFYEESGVWHYEDGGVYGAVDFGELPDGGRTLNISEWSSEFRNKGHSVRALEWLRPQFAIICANGVGTNEDDIDGDGAWDVATHYWAHMMSKGLIDEMFDDNGATLVVSADGTISHAPKTVADVVPSLGAFDGAVCEGDYQRLAVLLQQHDAPADLLSAIFDDYDGTLHYRALERTMSMARHEHAQWAVQGFLECARLLRHHGAPAEHKHSPCGVAMVFLDSDWSPSAHKSDIATLMREYIESGLLDVNAPIPKHAVLEGLMPLACALKLRNPIALQVLLDAGAHISASLAGTGHTDIIDFAKSLGNTSAVTSVLVEHLMRTGLREAAEAGASNADAPAAPRRRQVGV
jgi:hypothetical protein